MEDSAGVIAMARDGRMIVNGLKRVGKERLCSADVDVLVR